MVLWTPLIFQNTWTFIQILKSLRRLTILSIRKQAFKNLNSQVSLVTGTMEAVAIIAFVIPFQHSYLTWMHPAAALAQQQMTISPCSLITSSPPITEPTG